MTSPINKLGLGSGQFGLDQQAGARARPRDQEAREILAIAARSGVGVLEVGRHPNSAEITLGQVLPKPQPFRLTVTTVRPDRGADLVEAEVRGQLARLGVSSVDAILAPSATDLFSPHGPELWDRLRKLRDEGLCRQIGVSVYASDDPVGLARRFKPDLVQAPASLLDQRMLIDGTLAELAGVCIEVHLRSIFLNGLLFLPPDRAPNHLKAAAGRISRARRLISAAEATPTSTEEASVLVGVASAAEMSAVGAAAMSPPPDLDWDEMALDDPDALPAWAPP